MAMRFRKILSLVLAMVMVVGLMPTTAMATVSTGNENPQLTKKAEWVDQENGLAKITLKAKGTPIVTPKKGADVVVVMDYSGSMEKVISSETVTCGENVEWTYKRSFWWGEWRYVYSGKCSNNHSHEITISDGETPPVKSCDKQLTIDKTRWQASKNALATLLDQIIPDSESVNKVAAIAFDSDVRYGYTNSFTNNKGSIITTIDNLVDPHPSDKGATIQKGTNYVKALQTAYDYINNRSDKSRDAYVVFLSDGEPDSGKEGTSEIQAIKSQGTTVYTVGLALNSSSAISRLQTYASKTEYFHNISTADDLDGIFQDIGQTIASGVTIWDTIDTRYFSVAKKPGENVSYEASNGNEKVQFTNSKDFVWNFENFSTDGETLEIYIQLRAEYLNTNANYPTNTAGSAKGEYVGLQGTKVNLEVTEDHSSSAVPQLPTMAVPTYTVTGTIDNGGTVTNGNQQNVSTSLEMVFTANPGYYIASITRNGISQSLTGITTSYVYPGGAVTENVAVSVTTAENPNATITYTAGNGGSVSPTSNSVPPATGSAAGSTATPNPGFHFVNWTVGGTVAGTTATLTTAQVNAFAKNGEGLYVATEFIANFEEDSDVTINYAAVGGGAVSKDSETLQPSTGDAKGSTATANKGHEFIGWATTNTATTAADCISTKPHYIPSKVGGVYQAATYYAIFSEKIVTMTYINGVGGTVNPESETFKAKNGKPKGSTAEPNTGYHFVDWRTESGDLLASGVGKEKYVPQPNADGVYESAKYYASFAKNSYSVSGTIDNGTVVGGDQTKEYETQSDPMVFTASTGYHITGIKVNNVVQSLEGITTSYTYPSQTVTGAITVEVTTAINGYAVTGTIDNGEVTNGSQNVNHGISSEAMVFTATTGYHITSIKVNNVAQSLDGITTSYTYPSQTVTGAITVEVTTSINEYTVTGTIDNGEVTKGSQNVNHGSSSEAMVFTATTGYHITGIKVNNVAQSLDEITTSYTYPSQTVTGAITVEVTTAINGYAVTGTIDNGEVTNGSQNVNHGISSKAMVFTATTGYHITGIKVNNVAQSLDEITTSYTYPSQTVTGALTVEVTTEEDDVEILYHAGDGGAVTRNSETVKAINGVPQGSTAVPNAGFHFVKWTFIEGVEVGTEKTLIPSKGDSPVYVGGTYTAIFAEDEEVTIYYEAQKGGSVSLESEDVLPSTGVAVGSTATAYTGYTFFNWTNTKGDVVSTSYNCVPVKADGVYVADTYTANFKPKYYSFVVEDIYNSLSGEEIDELHSITGNDPSEKVAFGSEISSAKNDYLRGYEYSEMQVFVDVNEQQATNEELSELGITVDRENGTLTGNLPDHQIWVKYIYNEVEKYRVDYTSEGKVTGIPTGITDAIAGDEITISKDVPARDGFDFLEWIPQINGDPIHVTDGKFIMPDGNVEVRATWKANEEIFNYDVKYYTEDGKLIVTIPSTVLKSDPIVTTVEDKAPEGYKLQGYTFNGGEMTTELSAEITEDGQTIAVYYEKNDLIVKHVYGSATVYDSNQSKANLSVEGGNVVVNAVTSGRYTRITSATLNSDSLGRVTTVTVVPNGESKYEVVFTYGIKNNDDSDGGNYTPSNPGSSDSTPGEEVTIIEDPAVALQDGLESIDHFAYVFGYEDGTVRPENKVTREEVATIFYRLLTDGTRDALFTREQDFPDVSSSRWSNVAIATLLNGNIVSGYPDGEFKPGNYITRAEFAAIVAKFDNLSYSGENNFTDIYAHWAANYINSAAIKGWINGYPDGSFNPDAYISRAEAITLINAVLGRQVSKDGLLPEAKYWSDNTPDKWYYEAVMEATNSHDYERETDSNIENWTELKADKIWTER